MRRRYIATEEDNWTTAAPTADRAACPYAYVVDMVNVDSYTHVRQYTFQHYYVRTFI